MQSQGGVDAVSLANNHSGDFGAEGKKDTIAALDAAGILHSDAYAPLICEMPNGITVGIVSYNTVVNLVGEWQWCQDIKADLEMLWAAVIMLIR